MYINDRRVRVRRRNKLPRGMAGVTRFSDSGLGGASDCGADQVWCPNYQFNGMTGMCTTPGQCNQWNTDHPAPQQTGTSWLDTAGGIAGAISKIFGTQPQVAPPVMVDTGPSTTTLLALGAAGLLGVYLITRK